MNDEEKQAKADELAEGLKRANEEFIRDTPGVHPIGKVRKPGERYGHPFHDRVADYIEQQNGKLQASFMEGFNSAAQDKAISYLRGMGIITANTPTERVNEFLVAWGIAPLPTREVVREVTDISPSMPVDVGEVKMVTPSQDDEIVDAEIVEDEVTGVGEDQLPTGSPVTPREG